MLISKDLRSSILSNLSGSVVKDTELLVVDSLILVEVHQFLKLFAVALLSEQLTATGSKLLTHFLRLEPCTFGQALVHAVHNFTEEVSLRQLVRDVLRIALVDKSCEEFSSLDSYLPRNQVALP